MGMSPVQLPRALCQEGLKLGVLWFAGPPWLEILDFIFECVLCRWRVMEQWSMCWAGGGRPATASPFLGSVLGYVLLAFGHFTPFPHCWPRTPRVAQGGGSTGTSTGVGNQAKPWACLWCLRARPAVPLPPHAPLPWSVAQTPGKPETPGAGLSASGRCPSSVSWCSTGSIKVRFLSAMD